MTKPIITASPKTPLVVLKKDEDGTPKVEINPTPEAPTPATASPKAVTKKSINKKASDSSEAPIVAPPPPAEEPEVKASKTATKVSENR